MKYIKCRYSVEERFEVQTFITGYRVKTYFYELFEDGRLVVERGYPWDGASGAINTTTWVKASCVHDIFCEMINGGLLPVHVQALADEQMRVVAAHQNMGRMRRVLSYFVVRWYQITKEPGVRKKVYEVP